MLEQPAPSTVARADPDRGAPWWRIPLGMVSPAGPRGRLAIVMFHRVHAQPDALFPGEIDAVAFRTRLAWLRTWFNVLPLEDAVAALSRGTLPARALAITFDDGYADNVDVALPILRELGMPATFFIATGFLDGGRMWNDTVIEGLRRAPGPMLDLTSIGDGVVDLTTLASRRTAIDKALRALKYLPPDTREARVRALLHAVGADLPRNLMMSGADVRRLSAAGMSVGAHTVHHPILASVDAAAARDEIAHSRETLEALLRRPVTLFAYPNGKPNRDYRARDVEIARTLGFTAAFSTAHGVASRRDPLHELPRFTPWDRTPARWGARLVRNYFTPIKRAVA